MRLKNARVRREVRCWHRGKPGDIQDENGGSLTHESSSSRSHDRVVGGRARLRAKRRPPPRRWSPPSHRRKLSRKRRQRRLIRTRSATFPTSPRSPGVAHAPWRRQVRFQGPPGEADQGRRHDELEHHPEEEGAPPGVAGDRPHGVIPASLSFTASSNIRSGRSAHPRSACGR